MYNNAIVNLIDLKQNALKIKSKLKTTKFCAVVKADAYGHGACPVANALYSICDCFAVALVEEGVNLRQGGIDKEILVLIPPFLGEIERAISYDLSLTVDNISLLYHIQKTCEKLNKKCKIHIKFNSGMNRLGVDNLQDLQKILDVCDKLKTIKVQGLFSHYACPEDKKCFESATEQFLLANNLVKGYNKNIISHISASGGYLKGALFDMVRIGIMLYGYTPLECDFPLTPIMKVYSPVVKRREIQKGQNYLYGNDRLLTSQSVSIIRYGYADGLSRNQIEGQLNNRCMDLTMIKGQSKKAFVPIMTDAGSLAKEYQTIPYEILTKVGMRAQKIYIN